MVTLVVGSCCYLTLRRNIDYESPLNMWADVVKKRPENSRGHTNLGAQLADRGAYEDALEHFQLAVSYDPKSASAHCNVGEALVRLGRVEEGKAELEEALRLRPTYAFPHYDLGKVHAAEGRNSEAIDHFLLAVRFDPSHAPAYCGLGVVYERLGRLDDAIDAYRRAISVDREWAAGFSRLALALLSKWDLPSSKTSTELVVSGVPPDVIHEADQFAGRALELTGDHDGLSLEAISAVLAMKKMYTDAIRTGEEALKLASEAGDKDLVNSIEDRLKKYRAAAQ